MFAMLASLVVCDTGLCHMKIWVHINKHIIFVCFLPGGLGEPKWINVQEVVNIQKDNKETIPDGEREQVETYS